MKDKILSIQSKLVYGYVGNNIAELAIQLHGLDVISFPTVYLSAHTGHQPVYGMRIGKNLFEDLISGIENLNILDTVAHTISGYIGSEEVLIASAGFIEKIKSRYPDVLYICDPVMGDEEGLYLDKALANKIITSLIPICDIMTPNHFEFEYIVGKKARTIEDIISIISAHPILKNKTVIITSCHLETTDKDYIETLIVQEGKSNRISTPRVSTGTTGTGDLFTAVAASQLALGKDIITAAQTAAQVVSKALRYAVDAGNVEMNAKSVLQSVLKDDFTSK